VLLEKENQGTVGNKQRTKVRAVGTLWDGKPILPQEPSGGTQRTGSKQDESAAQSTGEIQEEQALTGAGHGKTGNGKAV
jgi:hypothetical protein